MPLHDWQCADGHVTELYTALDEDRDTLARTCGCGLRMLRVFLQAPLVRGDLPGYESPVTGTWVEGRAARERDLERSGCRPYDDGEKEEYVRRKASAERDFDKRLESTIDETICVMPAQKRERLQSEMESGVDVEFSRTTPQTT